jgi:hypothetical protein
MRLRHCLLVLVSVLGLLMLSPFNVVSGEIQPPPMNDDEQASTNNDAAHGAEAPGPEKSNDEVAPAPLPTPLQLSRTNKIFESAYMDTYNILSEDNSCSTFYGGPLTALTVFNQLFGQLRTEYVQDARVGITMTTPVTMIDDHKTGSSYRLFSKAKLNSNGPFYKNRITPTNKLIPDVGAFQANTREARALMLLHELGHLMKGQDNHWLLQDDGSDPLLSIRNTKTVERHCAKQIRELGDKVFNTAKLLAAKKPPEPVAEQADIPGTH